MALHSMKCSLGVFPLALAFLGGCSDPNAQVRGEFLSGCIRGGTPKSLCVCAFERLEKRFTTNELNQFLRSAMSMQQATQLRQETIRALLACHSK